MAGAGAGPDPGGPAVGEPGTLAPGDEEWRDWAGGLPAEVLEKVAGKVVTQTEVFGWWPERWRPRRPRRLKKANPNTWTGEVLQEYMANLKLDGHCLFVFARVCKGWRKAQLKVGGPLCTRVGSDVIAPGSVALVKWALAEGCPRENEDGVTMAEAAAPYGHLELVKWLCGEGGFAMDEGTSVMAGARFSRNQELVDWLQAELSASH